VSDMTNDAMHKIARGIRALRGKPMPTKPVGPSGLPSPRFNADNVVDGAYNNEGTVSVPIQNGVTGTGDGAVIGASRLA